MRHLGIRALPIFIVLLFCPMVRSQESTPTVAQFKASIRTMQTNSTQWRKVVESVNVDDLPVQYATGKQYEQSKNIVEENLKMVLLWGSRAVQSGSLFDEINYMSAVQELQTQLQLFSSLIIDFTVTDKAKTILVQNWATGMTDLATGPIDAAFKTAYEYTTWHALQAVKACGMSR